MEHLKIDELFWHKTFEELKHHMINGEYEVAKSKMQNLIMAIESTEPKKQ